MSDELSQIKKIGNWISAILLGNIREVIARIDERTKIMQIDLADIKPKVDELYPKVDVLWKDKFAPVHSPRQLNERGNKILEESGIKEIIEEKKIELLKIIKEKGDKNPYDAEVTILSVVNNLPTHCPDVVEKLKTGAFNTGSGIGEILLVGGIYLRNIIFSELGFKIDDLDKPITE